MSELIAIFETDKGTIRIKLFADQAPVTVGSFANLVGRGYYDGLNFHRVLADFMVQGGCPQGSGTGGPGYRFENECSSNLKHDKPGVLSMANSGPGTNGSQFFITHGPTPWLDGKHTVFGEVESSGDMDVVNQIAQGDGITKVSIEGDTSGLFEGVKERIAEWNSVLEKLR